MRTILVLLLLMSGSASALQCWQGEDRNDWYAATDLGPFVSDDPASPLEYQGIGKEFAWYVQPSSLLLLFPSGGAAEGYCYPTNELVVGHLILETRIGDYPVQTEECAVFCQPPPRPVEIPWWELWSRNAACYYGFSYCYYDPWDWDYY